jgi:hypothetical protein
MKEYSDRCYKCDQPRSTHDDGECAAVVRLMSFPAPPHKERVLEAFKKQGEPNGGVRDKS